MDYFFACIVRLYEGCLALDMYMDISIDELEQWIYKVIDANHQMRSGVHIRYEEGQQEQELELLYLVHEDHYYYCYYL